MRTMFHANSAVPRHCSLLSAFIMSHNQGSCQEQSNMLRCRLSIRLSHLMDLPDEELFINIRDCYTRCCCLGCPQISGGHQCIQSCDPCWDISHVIPVERSAARRCHVIHAVRSAARRCHVIHADMLYAVMLFDQFSTQVLLNHLLRLLILNQCGKQFFLWGCTAICWPPYIDKLFISYEQHSAHSIFCLRAWQGLVRQPNGLFCLNLDLLVILFFFAWILVHFGFMQI